MLKSFEGKADEFRHAFDSNIYRRVYINDDVVLFRVMSKSEGYRYQLFQLKEIDFDQWSTTGTARDFNLESLIPKVGSMQHPLTGREIPEDYREKMRQGSLDYWARKRTANDNNAD